MTQFTELIVTEFKDWTAGAKEKEEKQGKEVITMHVSVRVSPDVAQSLRQRERIYTTELQELLRIENELGIELEPLYPNAKDSSLTRYFKVRVDNHAAAKQVADRLRSCKGIESAYVKPLVGLPEPEKR
jgi:Ni,Fe-hydrogenase III component G